MKKIVMLLLATTSCCYSSAFNTINEEFLRHRMNAFGYMVYATKGEKTQKNFDYIEEEIKGTVNVLDRCLESQPSKRKATAEDRVSILESMAHKAIFKKTAWYKSTQQTFSKPLSNHFLVLDIMMRAISLLIEEPFAMVNSNFIYKDLKLKLRGLMNIDDSKKGYLTSKNLKSIIPESFFNKFLKLLVNANTLNKSTESKAIQDQNALYALALRKGVTQPLIFDQKKGYLCLDDATYLLHKQGTRYQMLEKKDDKSDFTYYTPSANEIDEDWIKIYKIGDINSHLISKLFYSADEMGKVLTFFTNIKEIEYVLQSSLYNYWQEEVFVKSKADILVKLIENYGHLGALKSLKYIDTEYDRILPLSLEDTNFDESLLDHPLIIEGYNGFYNSLKQQQDKELPQNKLKYQIYIDICNLKFKLNLESFKEGYALYQASINLKNDLTPLLKKDIPTIDDLSAALHKIVSDKKNKDISISYDQAIEIYIGNLVSNEDINNIIDILELKTLDREKLFDTLCMLNMNLKEIPEDNRPDFMDSVIMWYNIYQYENKKILTTYDQALHMYFENKDKYEKINRLTTELQLESFSQGLYLYEEACKLKEALIKNDSRREYQLDTLIKKLHEIYVNEGNKKNKLISYEEVREIYLKKVLEDNFIDKLNPEKMLLDIGIYANSKEWGAREVIMNLARGIKYVYEEPLTNKKLTMKIEEYLQRIGASVNFDFNKVKFTTYNAIKDLEIIDHLSNEIKEYISKTSHLDFQGHYPDDKNIATMRQLFFETMGYLHELDIYFKSDGFEQNKSIVSNEVIDNVQENFKMIKMDFQYKMEDQIGKCHTGLKTRLFLIRLQIAGLVKKLYEHGF